MAVRRHEASRTGSARRWRCAALPSARPGRDTRIRRGIEPMTVTDETKELGSADIQKILELLPHRYPFLMVDRIVDIDRDESARGLKNVSFNEPHFQGHFPGHPVMP